MSISIEKVFSCRDLLVRGIRGWSDKKLDHREWHKLVEELVWLLPSTIDRGVIVDSVRYLIDATLTLDQLNDLAWRFAGNQDRLRNGHPATPWKKQVVTEAVMAQIVEVEKAKRGDQQGHLFHFRILSGTSCPIVTKHWWSFKQQAFQAYYLNEKRLGFGFSRKPSLGSQFFESSQFVTLRCLLLIDPAACLSGPGFTQIDFSPDSLAWNKEQLRYRRRAGKKYVCRHKIDVSIPCHACWIGLDGCRAAVHRLTYIPGECSVCGLTQQPLEPGSTVCVNCQNVRSDK